MSNYLLQMPSINRLLFIFFLSSIFFRDFVIPSGHAQQSFVDEVIPPSPNASAFGKYGDIPVGLHTGTPNIQIPLYEIKTGDITVPITLSYHSSGIKVGETASWVGLGWSLNAGGAITRSVKGGPDEQYGYFQTVTQLKNYEDQGILHYAEFELPGVNNFPSIEQTSPGYTDFKEFMWFDLMIYRYDTEPDLFYFNYPGGSGQFVFDADQTPRLIPYSNIIVDASMNTSLSPTGLGDIHQFEIKDEMGRVYSFTEEEVTTVNSGFSITKQNFPFSSTWYLDRISSGSSPKSVTFSYKSSQTHTDLINSSTITEKFDFHGQEVPCSQEDGSINQSLSNTTINTKFLETIVWEQGQIQFYSTNQREDSNGSYQLDSLSIFNYEGDLVKTIVFNYGYFESPSVSNLGRDSYPTEQKHLKLLGIYERFPSGETKPPHQFTYFGNPPARNSASQDHWGYYNAAYNTSLVPEFLDWQGALRPGADREPNFEASLNGILTDIVYPTGGFTHFEYEANEHYSGLPLIAEKQYHFFAEDAELFVLDDQEIQCLVCQNETVSSFTTGDLTGAGGSSISISILYPENDIFPEEHTSIRIIKASNSEEAGFFSFNDHNQTFPLSLESNTEYRVEAKALHPTSKVFATISLNEVIAPATNKKQTGGLRIKRIESNDGINGPGYNVREYEYTQEDDPNRSSGVLATGAEPDYESQLTTNVCVNGSQNGGFRCFVKECHTVTRHGNAQNHLGRTNGSHVVYTEVKEKFGPGGSNGWRQVEFSHHFGTPETIIHNPPQNMEYTNMNWANGKVEREALFSSNGTLLSETLNEYTYVNDPSHPLYNDTYAETRGYKYQLVVDNKGLWTISYHGNAYAIGAFSHISAFSYLSSTRNRVYSQESPDLFTETVQTYFYEDASHLQPTRMSFTNSEGRTLYTRYTYSSGLVGMSVANILTRPVEIYTYDDANTMVSAIKNTYDGNYFPTRISNASFPYGISLNQYQSNRDYYLETQRNITYDNRGNITKVEERDGRVTELVWNPYSLLTSKIDRKEEGINSPEDMITVYDHIPLIGIRSVTDPNGQTVIYEYDGQNRLKSIKDHNGDIIQIYDYKYWNE